MRGRRFFLMGALALPVSAAIARAAPVVAVEYPKLTGKFSDARLFVNGVEIKPFDPYEVVDPIADEQEALQFLIAQLSYAESHVWDITP